MVTLDGAPWFVSGDVCKALDLTPHPSGGYTNHFKRLADNEKTTLTKSTIQSVGLNLPNRFVAVSESGLYKLIMRSDKPEARDFQNWVTRVVLPAVQSRLATLQGWRLHPRGGARRLRGHVRGPDICDWV
ncbi:putative phage-encoded protein [Hartmannibacter diazotrophicus]|uniref:Putative phage-encoded protein n=1 Tax=Hartmannibacter diazotrophicus TaxID=1482074 RepID=A0A2C9D0B4_9HYPH|nr:BRO family protein [Hartmannibacter diazotrophicus]SON53700.1 putative phage-encoded protein [Hartmannibacter diazotrophicus]